MKYNKLIRDKIPEIIRAKGREPIIHIADQQEYWQKLKEKLVEEFKEFEAAESPEELADVLEVIDAIIKYKNFDFIEIKKIKEQKAQARGKFEKRIILDES
ncbi:MAG: nucleoside triphosphate pyrophosphohydrolase [Patescibacteria group bacterium]|jgi:predicted house-cleaning noncanonical NTP pyrophosphatase (MazG superfamily)|nr:nucleoside triphosphate pyrophosphohydrolase [Patescibacteria group bacterium]